MASPLGRRRRRRWRTSLPETAQDFRRRHLLRVVATQPRVKGSNPGRESSLAGKLLFTLEAAFPSRSHRDVLGGGR